VVPLGHQITSIHFTNKHLFLWGLRLLVGQPPLPQADGEIDRLVREGVNNGIACVL
jgi:hypothetical protein